jgi:hypothetical protein
MANTSFHSAVSGDWPHCVHKEMRSSLDWVSSHRHYTFFSLPADKDASSFSRSSATNDSFAMAIEKIVVIGVMLPSELDNHLILTVTRTGSCVSPSSMLSYLPTATKAARLVKFPS